MARITSDVAVAAIGNRYEMILVAARRARELSRGDMPRVTKVSSHVVTALREINRVLWIVAGCTNHRIL
jgi:DNA-directed RNA polymerase omega subunit